MFRCQAAVLFNSPEDNLGICYQCRYTFCRKCRETYHFQAICPKDYALEKLRQQQEQERQRIQRQREEALAKLAAIEKERRSTEERKLLKEKYRVLVIKLSEQDALLEDFLNGY